MEKDDIHLSDLKRIFIGNAPPEFLLEVFIRTVFIYIALLIVVRLLGKRLSARATLTEMALTITLGAIVGSPMQIPERGLLIGLFVLTMALAFQQFMNRLSFKSSWLETLTQGKVNLLVSDGILNMSQMRSDRISRRQLYASLRDKKIQHLGQVTRVYLEASGQFSIICTTEKRPGLSVMPEDDKNVMIDHKQKVFACRHCGKISDSIQNCPNCGCNNWEAALA